MLHLRMFISSRYFFTNTVNRNVNRTVNRNVNRTVNKTTNRQMSTMFFTESHEYLKYNSEKNIGTIGITNYAQESLGDVVFVESIISNDTDVEKGEDIVEIESVKATSAIYAPVDGKILEFNEKLEEESDLINKSAEDEGWIIKIEPKDTEQFNDLMNKEEYDKFTKELD